MDLLPDLLPLGTSLRVLDLVVDAAAQEVTAEVAATAATCPCPSCQEPATRIHSHYQRTVADLPPPARPQILLRQRRLSTQGLYRAAPHACRTISSPNYPLGTPTTADWPCFGWQSKRATERRD
jgi:hypothetical protein